MIAVERPLARMNSTVDFQILASGELLATGNAANECIADEWFLAGVDSKMIDELVLGLERLVLASASGPGASSIIVGRAIDVVKGEMIDEIGHFREGVAAHLTVVHPFALMVSVLWRLTVVGFRNAEMES